jgi:hypothetical protein
MSTSQEITNKATFERFQDATNTCNAEFISQPIDEIVKPDALIRTPLPLGGPAPRNSRRCSPGSIEPSPTFTSRSRT